MARDFDGSTDRIDYANIIDWSGSALTFAAWVYFDALAAGGTSDYIITAQRSSNASQGAILSNDDSQAGAIAGWRDWTSTFEEDIRWGTGDFTTATWHHAMWTSDSGATVSGMNLYVDGSEPSSSSTTTGGGSQESIDTDVSVGGRIADDNRNLNGRICEIGMWSRVLSADERAALAKGFSPLFFRRGLEFYTKMIGRKDIDIISGKTPTYDGTSIIEHPRIIYPG